MNMDCTLLLHLGSFNNLILQIYSRDSLLTVLKFQFIQASNLMAHALIECSTIESLLISFDKLCLDMEWSLYLWSDTFWEFEEVEFN